MSAYPEKVVLDAIRKWKLDDGDSRPVESAIVDALRIAGRDPKSLNKPQGATT